MLDKSSSSSHCSSLALKCPAKSFASFPGGQSDQGYDSLSKEEERVCRRESDCAALLEEKGRSRQPCELLMDFLSPIRDLRPQLMQAQITAR